MARVSGCMGCILMTDPEKQAQGKLGARGIMAVCLGVDSESKAWKMLDLEEMHR